MVIIFLQNFLLNLRFVNKNDIVQKISLSSGFINHIKYFFDSINLEYTYYHTINEVEQQKIIKLPNITKLISYAYYLIINIIIFLLILIPIAYSIKEFVDVWKMNKEWPISDNKTNYIIFIILLVSVYIYYFKNNVKNLMESIEGIVFTFFTMLIIAILLYTLLIIGWEL